MTDIRVAVIAVALDVAEPALAVTIVLFLLVFPPVHAAVEAVLMAVPSRHPTSLPHGRGGPGMIHHHLDAIG
jgi:hypothetical protein